MINITFHLEVPLGVSIFLPALAAREIATINKEVLGTWHEQLHYCTATYTIQVHNALGHLWLRSEVKV